MRRRYLAYVVKTYKAKQAALTTAVVLDFVYNVIQTVAMPYPKAVVDDLLDLVQLLVPSLKSTTDNKMKGFFLEFVEQCVELKPSGVDSKRIDGVVSAISSVTYICCSVCLIIAYSCRSLWQPPCVHCSLLDNHYFFLLSLTLLDTA